MQPKATERILIVREPWTFGAAGQHYDASVTPFVNSGNTPLEKKSQVVSVNPSERLVGLDDASAGSGGSAVNAQPVG